jgi:IS5 family transposase
MGHALTENRGDDPAPRAMPSAWRRWRSSNRMPTRPQPITLAADKGYDTGDFVMELRNRAVTPHVAQNNSGRRSAIDGRTTRYPRRWGLPAHPQTHRGGLRGAKTVVGLRKMRHGGLPKVDWQFTLAMAACDLVPLPKPLAQTAARP